MGHGEEVHRFAEVVIAVTWAGAATKEAFLMWGSGGTAVTIVPGSAQKKKRPLNVVPYDDYHT